MGSHMCTSALVHDVISTQSASSTKLTPKSAMATPQRIHLDKDYEILPPRDESTYCQQDQGPSLGQSAKATKKKGKWKGKWETAEEGKHFITLGGQYVCKTNSAEKNCSTYGNHAFKMHDLISTGTSESLYALDKKQEEHRQRDYAIQRKKPGDSLCYNCVGARGS